MIDTHSHIYGPEFDEDRGEAIQRAKAAGVEKILLPNINVDTIRPMLDLCNQYQDYCFPMLGLHPEDVTNEYPKILDEMERKLQAPNPYIAVGEVGLDFYWDKTFYHEQIEAFNRQIHWAHKYNLPLVIHTRGAHSEMIDIMEQHRDKNLKGIFHCFGGTIEEAKQLLTFRGFMLGIGGVVTFKKSKLPDVLASAVPLSRIVLETDCPYLAPTPHRGKRNESSYVAEVLHKLAIIYNVSEDEIEHITTSNANSIFFDTKQGGNGL